jgi:CRISPR-associated protein Cas5t
VLAIRLEVPIACWRKGYARELLETEELPPPATCYGALLSFVGETERGRHRLVRITSGIVGTPPQSTVVRTIWRVKSTNSLPGNGENAKPDFQQLLTNATVIIWVDSSNELGSPNLEQRIRAAFLDPASVTRFGGWSLGESTHLINDMHLLGTCAPPVGCRMFLVDPAGDKSLPVWVDHIGTATTRHAVGKMVIGVSAPSLAQLAEIA